MTDDSDSGLGVFDEPRPPPVGNPFPTGGQVTVGHDHKLTAWPRFRNWWLSWPYLDEVAQVAVAVVMAYLLWRAVGWTWSQRP